MGNVCSQCCPAKDDVDNGENERSPLLGGSGDTVPSGGAHPKRSSSHSESYDNDSVPTTVVVQPGRERGEAANAKYLTDQERLPLVIKKSEVKEVDDQFKELAEAYNECLQALNRLRDVRAKLLQQCELQLDALDSAMKYIAGHAESELRLWRDDACILLFEYNEVKVTQAQIRGLLQLIIQATELISQLETVDVATLNTQALTIFSSKKDLERKVLVAKQGDKGPEYMANCKAAIKLIGGIPERWQKIIHERDDLIKEFIHALKCLVSDPLDSRATCLAKQREKPKVQIEAAEVSQQMQEAVEQPTEQQATVDKWLHRLDNKDNTDQCTGDAETNEGQETDQQQEDVEQKVDTEVEQCKDTEQQRDDDGTEQQKDDDGSGSGSESESGGKAVPSSQGKDVDLDESATEGVNLGDEDQDQDQDDEDVDEDKKNPQC